jgi:hypothetical protein
MIRPFLRLPILLAAALLASPLMVPCAAAEPAAFQAFEGATAAAQVSRADIDRELVVVGPIQKYIASTGERVPHRLQMGPVEGSSLVIVFWPDLAPAIMGSLSTLPEGTRVTAKGKITDYRGTPQIAIRTPDQIRIEGVVPASGEAAGKAPAAPTSNSAPPVAAPKAIPVPGADGYFTVDQIPALRDSMVGQQLSFKGTITKFTPAWSERAPNVIHFGPESAELQVVYWKGNESVPNFDKVGSMLYVTGELGTYQNRLQLRANDLSKVSYEPLPASAIAVPKPPPPASTTPAKPGEWPGRGTASYSAPGISPTAEGFIPLNQLSAAQDGQTVRAQGQVFAVRQTEADAMLMLKDPNGQVLVRLAAGQALPSVGAPLKIEGRVTFNPNRSAHEIVEARIIP